MRPKTGALIGIFAAHAVLGVCAVASMYAQQTGGVSAHVALAVAGFLAGLFPFAWVLHDRRELSLRRSIWYNIWLAYFPLPATAIHLWRSRSGGRRFMTMMLMFGVVFGAYALVVVGMIVATIALTITTGATGI